MSAIKTIRRAFTIDGHRATLKVPIVGGAPIGITVEWDKGPPRLRRAGLARYRKLRNAILAGVANEIGGAILVADVEADDSVIYWVIHPTGEVALLQESEYEAQNH